MFLFDYFPELMVWNLIFSMIFSGYRLFFTWQSSMCFHSWTVLMIAAIISSFSFSNYSFFFGRFLPRYLLSCLHLLHIHPKSFVPLIPELLLFGFLSFFLCSKYSFRTGTKSCYIGETWEVWREKWAMRDAIP